MAGRIDEFERPRAKLQSLPVLGDQHPLGGRRAIARRTARDRWLRVHLDGAGDQFRRVDHVRCAARVQHCLGVWQRLKQLAGAAGVIEVARV
jgi:hypothetical protein